MDLHVRDALVTGYESLIPSVSLPDDDDRHVLAAAIRCNASVIVTFNTKDFPEETLAQYEIEAQHPDDFLCNLLDLHPDPTVSAVKKSYQRFKNPPIPLQEYLNRLSKLQLAQTVELLSTANL